MKESTQTEMLTVSRKRVQKAYNECDRYFCFEGMLEDLFGSKCLPDGLSEVKRDLSEVKQDLSENLSESQSAEPKETFTDGCQSPCKNLERLRIAAMAMAGLLANEGVSCFTDVQDLEHMDFITYHAFEYADKLIKKSEEENDI